MNVYIEGYGCSLNKGDTEQLRGAVRSSGAKLTGLGRADFAIINTCAVKLPTEYKMLKRIRELYGLSKKHGFKLIAFGCLSRINPKKILAISGEIIIIGPDLGELTKTLSIPNAKFSPLIEEERENEFVSIIGIARGCRGNCSYCAVRQARGGLKSYPVKELNEKFAMAIKKTKEIWLTAQDTGCYGLDLKTSLPMLLEELLKNNGDYRIRLGMMNPEHVKSFYSELVPLLNDKRVYRFLHIPVQSGSDKVLESMGRNYAAKDFASLVSCLKRDVKGITIITDVIVGFPGETKRDFEKTIALLKKTIPGVVNISRYGERPNTGASKMKDNVYPGVKKERSRALTELCSGFSLAANKKLEGSIQEVLVTERGRKGNFIGRTQNYRRVAVERDLRGKFAKIRLERAFTSYLSGVPI